MNLPRMTLLVYAALMLLGGIWGAAKSPISLIAGAASALILFGISTVAQRKPKTGAIGGLIVALLLTGNFASRYFKTQHFIPSGLFGIISVIALLAFAVGVAQHRNDP